MTFKLDNEQVHFKVKDNKDNIKEAGTKILASQLSLDCRARRSG